MLASTPSARTFVSNGNSYVKSLSFDSPSRRAGAGGAAASPSPGRGGHGATFSSLRRGGSSSRSGRGGASGRHGNVPRGRGRPSSASGMAPLRPTVYYHMEQGRTGRRVEAAKQQTSGNNDWRWQCCDKEHEEADIMASMNLYMQQRPMTVPVSPHSMSARARKVTKTPLQIDEQNDSGFAHQTARPNTAAIVDRETMFLAAPSTAAMEPEGGRVILPQRIVVRAELAHNCWVRCWRRCQRTRRRKRRPSCPDAAPAKNERRCCTTDATRRRGCSPRPSTTLA